MRREDRENMREREGGNDGREVWGEGVHHGAALGLCGFYTSAVHNNHTKFNIISTNGT